MRRLAFLLVLVAATTSVAAAVGAPPPRDRALLASVMRGMKTGLRSVRIGAPPKQWAAKPGQQFLYVVPRTTKDPGRVADDWYALLIAGAYQAQCGKQTADCLVAFSVQGIGGSRVQATRTRPAHVSRAKLARAIRSRFAKIGLRVSALTFQKPYGLAPVVTIRSRRPQRAVTAFYKHALFVRLPIEGFLVRMVDRHGHVFLADGGSVRTKEGIGWTRRGLHVPGGKTTAAP